MDFYALRKASLYAETPLLRALDVGVPLRAFPGLVNCLVARWIDEAGPFFVTPYDTVGLDSRGVAALVVECVRIVCPRGVSERSIEVSSRTQHDAALLFALPSHRLAVGQRMFWNTLKDFVDILDDALDGNRSSLWDHGSDDEGFPEQSDLLERIRHGAYPASMLWMVERYGASDEIRNTLERVSDTDNARQSITTIEITHRMFGNLDVARLSQWCIQVQDRHGTELALTKLGHAAARGNRHALHALEWLSSDEIWLRTVRPPWMKKWRGDLAATLRAYFGSGTKSPHGDLLALLRAHFASGKTR